jgi:hypothetical protein
MPVPETGVFVAGSPVRGNTIARTIARLSVSGGRRNWRFAWKAELDAAASDVCNVRRVRTVSRTTRFWSGGRVVSANRLDVGGVDPTLLTVKAMHRYQRDASRAQVADCPINLVNRVLHVQLVAVDEVDHRFDLPCHDSDPIRGKAVERKSFQ